MKHFVKIDIQTFQYEMLKLCSQEYRLQLKLQYG